MKHPPQIIATAETLNSALEIWFIQNIVFAGATFITDHIPEKIDADLVIYLELNNIDRSLVRRLRSLKKKVILYHMGDELAEKNIAPYKEFDLVIRNYYFKDLFTPSAGNLIWAPNGYKSGIGPRQASYLKPAHQRNNLASFLGWLSNERSYRNERAEFSQIAKVSKNLNLLSSSGFSNGYNTSLYAATMEDSIFAPCPAGNSPETIRLYDALECGCIPITLRHDFITSALALGSIGQPPFQFLNAWNELPEFLDAMSRQMQTNPTSIHLMQSECIKWWEQFKTTLQDSIKDQLELVNQ